ncbi:TRAP transporter substrate-binding protein [Bacillus daqingensis]|uniref:TRAP transporter substrate-binding protein n=1 Tax=Bacillus daqingensis TaxID=872396 RepID=A0ABV9NWI7_9BACI
MKKYWMTPLSIVAGAAVLVGCGNDGNNEGNEGNPAENNGEAEENAEANAGADGESINLIAATQLDAESPFAVGFETFKEVIEEESGGSITVEIHTDGALGGNEDELVQNMETGSVDLVVASPGFMAQAANQVDFFAMPYLFESNEHWEAVVDGEVGESVASQVEDNSNFKILGYWSAGVRNYYGFEPIETPDDLQNVQIRTQDSPVVTNTWEALGANPTSVAWDEMYQALQNRVVDASENDFTNIYQASHHEVTDYISLTEHDYTTRFFFTSDEIYSSLSEEQQAAFDTAAEEATNAARESDRDLADESRQAIEDSGVEINEVDQTPFVEMTEDVRQDAAESLNMVDEFETVEAMREEE